MSPGKRSSTGPPSIDAPVRDRIELPGQGAADEERIPMRDSQCVQYRLDPNGTSISDGSVGGVELDAAVIRNTEMKRG